MKLFRETCPPEAFLNPELFRTGWDTKPASIGKDQYQSGLRLGRLAVSVSIGVTGVWGAVMKAGGNLSSCETIGHHAHTADLLRGFLDSGCEIVVYRWADKGWVGTRIK